MPRTPSEIRSLESGSYIATDGRKFMHHQLGRRYDDALAARGEQHAQNAPGGPFAQAAFKEHGHAQKVIIEREGLGRHRITVEHVDGAKSTHVAPDAFRAQQMAGELLQVEPMPSGAVHARSRQFPVGEREEKAQRAFDGEDEPDGK